MIIELYLPLSIHEIGQRPNQEDSIWPTTPDAQARLFVVCDGMGGHEKGEVASQTVAQSLGEWFGTRIVHPLTDSQLAEALAYAYQKLDMQDGGELKKMGTTLTLLYFDRNGVTAAHMGDSRIYHIRPKVGVLYQSRDHSVVFDLLQSGEITYEEMATYPQKNIITRAMTPGESNRMRPDVVHITDVRPNDYFYMCSDGMVEEMNNHQLLQIFSSQVSDEAIKQHLIAATASNHDNHTAWIIHVKGVSIEQGDERLVNEEATSRFNVVNIVKEREEEFRNASEDDVEVVSQESRMAHAPRIPVGKLGKFLKGFVIAIVTLFTLCFLGFLGYKFLHNKRVRKEIKEVVSIKKDNHQVRDTTTRDSPEEKKKPAEDKRESAVEERDSANGKIENVIRKKTQPEKRQ